MLNNKTQRDYDKEPIKIVNYSALFQLHIFLAISLFAIPLLVNDVYENGLSYEVGAAFAAWAYLMYTIFIKIPSRFKEKNSFFIFNNSTIKYHYKYLLKQEKDMILLADTNQISSISYCIVCELAESYGRWHYLTAWQLYRKSSIGLHIGKTVLFIRYVLTYFIFILPYKIFKLKKSRESIILLKKNIFIQFKNRNYFLVNVYSQKELDELINYFKKHNISTNNKTYFIPHLQNQSWFADKNEIWSDDFNDTEIPKDTFKKKLRRFFSLE